MLGKLTQLPNIGPVLEGNLEKIGVTSAEELAAIGAEQAFLRIRSEVAPTACLHQLDALAGAVAGVRKSQLSQERKEELKRWYRSL